MTAQNRICMCVLIFTGRVLLSVGLSSQTPESIEDYTNGIQCKTWDASFSKCKECHSGFLGINCMPCRYPSYGRDCQKKCNCNETVCNPSTGCEDGSPTLPPISTSLIIEKISVTQIMTLKTTAACSVGYFGSSCDKPCRYPSFGFHCQSECICSEEKCDHVVGCNAADCPVGFFGSSCDKPCRYPSFGLHCQSECICSEENCNHVVGCNESSIFCNFEEGHELQALVYSTVALSVWAIIQISIYLYLALHSSSAIQLNISYT
ncbi:cell death abnormality protein 1-like [Crassostrea angulata]|uniref:cell death abnormality protein 1-like n=1 Tax=Magallana angulata TaxID=2784310 RepID=UPI0022B14008|nr:cell death abnormality protein 1-like [Crassostrea angulata]